VVVVVVGIAIGDSLGPAAQPGARSSYPFSQRWRVPVCDAMCDRGSFSDAVRGVVWVWVS